MQHTKKNEQKVLKLEYVFALSNGIHDYLNIH